MTSATVTARTAAAVRDLHQRLWDVAPPCRTEAERSAARAAKVEAAQYGWLPSLAWDDIDNDPEPAPTSSPALSNAGGLEMTSDIDPIAVDRAIAGDGIRLANLNFAEQAEVIRRLTERGKSIRDIADQLATTKRTVSRRRVAAASAA